MGLAPGTRLGAYEIVDALGSGSMGEVYRARDTKLKRDVAIKVLPEALGADPDRVARFQRAAELLAALNHPNIAAVYGVEESGDVRAIAMELVEGETLDARLKDTPPRTVRAAGAPSPRAPSQTDGTRRFSGAIPVDEALAVARQIVDALCLHNRSRPTGPSTRSPRRRRTVTIRCGHGMGRNCCTSRVAGSSPRFTSPHHRHSHSATRRRSRSAEAGSGSSRNYDFTADGRLIGVAPMAQTEVQSAPLQVVLKWFAELKQRVPGGS
jgi:serine/threonine protein kinase